MDIEDAAGADVVILAVSTAEMTRHALNMGDLEGRVLIDCTWGPTDPHLGEMSGAEALQRLMPNARIVRAVPWTAWDDAKGVNLCADESQAMDAAADVFESMQLTVSRIGELRRARSLDRVHAGQMPSWTPIYPVA
jgi:predicted dinucleotide-binding enzyme